MTCEANPFTALTPQEPQLTQNSQVCTASALIGIEPTVVQNGGDVCSVRSSNDYAVWGQPQDRLAVAMRADSGSHARDGPCVSLSGLTSPLAAGSVSAMAGFPVPRYPAETAGRDRGVARWIPGLPVIVAGLAGRGSLRVGEPFQPGGQWSWTAPVTGPRGADLVLKIAFRFPGGEERDEAAALAAQPEPWLVIDPKPYVGDPAYDLLQHMLNCEDRLAAHPSRAGQPDGGTGRD